MQTSKNWQHTPVILKNLINLRQSSTQNQDLREFITEPKKTKTAQTHLNTG